MRGSKLTKKNTCLRSEVIAIEEGSYQFRKKAKTSVTTIACTTMDRVGLVGVTFTSNTPILLMFCEKNFKRKDN